MKKVNKRISALVSLMLVVTMLFGTSSVWAKGNNNITTLEGLREYLVQLYPSQENVDIIDKYVNIFSNDSMFLKEYSESPNTALENVKSVIMDELSPQIMPSWYEGGIYGTNTPLIQQSTSYYCGVASALQVISSYGEEGGIAGSSYDDKQVNLAKDMGGVGTNGAIVYQVRNAINLYVGYRETYKDLDCTNIEIDSLELKIIQSLRVDAPVILHSIPKYLTSYYPSSADTGHYIVVKAYNPNTHMVLLSDCNYNNQYYGEFLVPLQQVYNSVHSERGRHIIYGG
ncbi:C39 family peptidase [Paludicola sp. MB14-C6]|uniref:C39 family peptidase n=1 Tax=Paludihabitans sp. MB14-C6 TaxID=3070656 RepID=UPI0027DAD5E5|nr:C39 family peptidase [Paludicola sp. MB14-C6]WMJ23719.1 C39 family peptidase [Paludicola sp. MB14-C6]